jgi:hypothetical protein
MKPRIILYDWKPKEYHFRLEEFLDIEIDMFFFDYFDELSAKYKGREKGRKRKLSELERFNGIIAHSFFPGQYEELMKFLKSNKIRMIIQIEDDSLYEQTRECINVFDMDYEGLNLVKGYDELIEKAKEVFC